MTAAAWSDLILALVVRWRVVAVVVVIVIISRSSSSDESSSPTPGVQSPRDIYKIVEENETDDDKHFDADDENTTDDESLSQLSNDS